MTALPPPLAAGLAWIPFLHPLDATQHLWYFMLIPLAIGIAAAFKATRIPDRDFWHHYRIGVAMLSAKIVFGVLLLAAAAHLLVRVLLPLITEPPAGF